MIFQTTFLLCLLFCFLIFKIISFIKALKGESVNHQDDDFKQATKTEIMRRLHGADKIYSTPQEQKDNIVQFTIKMVLKENVMGKENPENPNGQNGSGTEPGLNPTQRAEVIGLIQEANQPIFEALDFIKNMLILLKQEVTALKQNVAILKQDVAILKEEVAELKQEVTALKQDVVILKQDVTILKQEVVELKQDVKDIKSCPTIQKELAELDNA